jgi:hypothetical protein
VPLPQTERNWLADKQYRHPALGYTVLVAALLLSILFFQPMNIGKAFRNSLPSLESIFHKQPTYYSSDSVSYVLPFDSAQDELVIYLLFTRDRAQALPGSTCSLLANFNSQSAKRFQIQT